MLFSPLISSNLFAIQFRIIFCTFALAHLQGLKCQTSYVKTLNNVLRNRKECIGEK